MARSNKEVTVGASSLKPKKKRIFGKILLTLIIGVLLGGSLVYYYLEIYTDSNQPVKKKSNSKNNVAEESIEDLAINSYLVKSLMSKIHFKDGTNEEKTLYVNDRTEAKELTESYLNNLLLKEAFSMKSSFTDSVSVSDLEQARINLFGKNYEVVIPTDRELGTCPVFTYDVGERTYTRESENCYITNDIEIVYSTVSATIKEKAEVNIFEAVAFVEGDKVYKSIDGVNNLSDEIKDVEGKDFKINSSIEKLNRYKYTFKYDKDSENYVFDSIELVK